MIGDLRVKVGPVTVDEGRKHLPPGVIRVEPRRRADRHRIAAGAARPDPAARQEADERRGLGPRRPPRRIRRGPNDRSPSSKRPPRRKPLDPARRAAFDVLRAVSERDAYANLALPALLRERGITGRDAAFATELTYGTCRTRGLLDAVIDARRGPTARPNRSGAAGPAAARHLPTAAHPGRTRTPRYPPPWSRRASNSIRPEPVSSTACCAPSRGATSSPGSTSWRRPPTPTRSATPRSCTPTRAGSRRRSPTRSARTPGSWTRCWPATTNARWCTWPRGPAC